MKAESFSNERNDGTINPGHGRLAYFEQITYSSLVQILSDVHQGEDNCAIQVRRSGPCLLRAALGNLPDTGNKLLDLVGGKSCSRLVTQRLRL